MFRTAGSNRPVTPRAAARAPPPPAARDAAGPTPPKAPASQLPAGRKMEGRDGSIWVVAETFRAGRHAWELVSPAPPKLVPLAPVAREAAPPQAPAAPPMQVSAAREAAPPVAAAAALGLLTAPAALVDAAPKPRHAEGTVRPSTSTEVVLCFTMMEHEGGKFGCSLPFRHAGPHVCEAPSARRRTQKRPLSL